MRIRAPQRGSRGRKPDAHQRATPQQPPLVLAEGGHTCFHTWGEHHPPLRRGSPAAGQCASRASSSPAAFVAAAPPAATAQGSQLAAPYQDHPIARLAEDGATPPLTPVRYAPSLPPSPPFAPPSAPFAPLQGCFARIYDYAAGTTALQGCYARVLRNPHFLHERKQWRRLTRNGESRRSGCGWRHHRSGWCNWPAAYQTMRLSDHQTIRLRNYLTNQRPN